MTSLAGRLAPGWAAILALFVFGGQNAFASPGIGSSPAAPPPDTAPTAESPVPSSSEDVFSVLNNRYVALVDKFHSAVARVTVVVPGETADAQPQYIVSTGFFVSRNGDLLTIQADKLEKNKLVYVDFEGIRYGADVVGYDLVTNLALLHCSSTPKNFSVLSLAESSVLPPIGSLLLALTSKQGMEPGPSIGQLQGYNINFADVSFPTLFLRTTIPDDGGEGGSPVLDLQGRLVGMIVARVQDSRSTFLLPARAVLRVHDDLQAKGKVAYGLLGFEIEQKASDQNGVSVVINNVYYEGPGRSAGLQKGDVLKSMGDATINSDLDLRQASFFAKPGQDLPMIVVRDGRVLNLTLRVGERMLSPAPPMAGNVPKPSPPKDISGDVHAPGLIPNPDQLVIPPAVEPAKSK